MVIISAATGRLCLPCYGRPGLIRTPSKKKKKRRRPSISVTTVNAGQRRWPARVARVACSVGVIGSCLVRRNGSVTGSVRHHRPACAARVYRRSCSCPVPVTGACTVVPVRVLGYCGRSISAPAFRSPVVTSRFSRGWSGRRKAVRYRDRALLPFRIR